MVPPSKRILSFREPTSKLSKSIFDTRLASLPATPIPSVNDDKLKPHLVLRLLPGRIATMPKSLELVETSACTTQSQDAELEVFVLWDCGECGWAIDVDGCYMHSFEIWLACLVVFPGAGNLAYTVLEYRLGQRNILSSFLENVMWILFFFFFGSLSVHLSAALLAHLFSYNIT
ncbi:hypothetical protein D9758_011571 [Tetrapyrgos nigripes]|uniref:Uncharacterized protein n=1 Tax=Tetrapyrgos nigripes TaxID=182062 RepID=A0A8H5CNB5_9AGAR|nr:hypothetical protein D9758_011571 [Tetrapyrgos nigripes]